MATTTQYPGHAPSLPTAGGGSHAKVAPGEIAVGVVVGRASEYFDFFVFGIACVLVFPQVFFPFEPRLEGTLWSFVIFSFAFIMRPIGTALSMAAQRRWGRATKLTIALFLLGTATVGMAFLPGYNVIGAHAITLLAVFRCLQGLALGGSWDGLPSLLALNAPPNRRGWYSMLGQLGAPVGFMVASALFLFLHVTLTEADFLEWGWRYPFFVAFAINVVALFARLRIVVTPAFQAAFETLELHPAPVTKAVREEGGDIIIGAFAPLASFAMFHMVTVFPLSWVFLYTEESPARFLMIELVGAVFGLAAILASGWLADRYGRRALLAVTAAGIAVFSGFAPQMLDGGPVGELAYMVLGFVLLGLSFGQASGAIASSFSLANRYTASALTSDLAWLFGAGFAPLAALALSGKFGLIAGGGYLLSGAVCTLLALWLNRELGRGRAGAKT